MKANTSSTNASSVVVALPAANDPVHALGPEPSHSTLAYLGDAANVDADQVNEVLAQVAAQQPPVTDSVAGKGTLGPDNAHVLHLDGKGLSQVRSDVVRQEPVAQAMEQADQFPTWHPHITIGYPDEGDSLDALPQPEQVTFDRIALWHGDQQTEHQLGGQTMTASAGAPIAERPNLRDYQLDMVPWYGVWAVEDKASGDKRTFGKNSLTNRTLPLPLTWQKAAQPAHSGEVKVGGATQMARVQNPDTGLIEVRAAGFMLQNAEADEVVGEMAAFGRVGCSIGVDDATFELDTTVPGPFGGAVNFTQARITNCTMVITGAYEDAWISLGEAPEGFFGDQPEQQLQPSTDFSVADIEAFGRGPGWVTDPKDTRRIHAYWTEPGQPGYAKIGWGKGGDFNRCRAEVGEEIGESSPAKLRFINQICAQWHKDALGYYPSTHAKMDRGGIGKHEALQPLVASVSMVASGRGPSWVPKLEWFSNPNLTEPTLLQFEDHPEGTRVYGHFAEHDRCHLDFPGFCVTPPSLRDGGANFMIHRVQTDGGVIAAGHITFGGGHADGPLGIVAARSHYDDASTVFCDVVVGEDGVGLWFSGWLRPDHNNDEDRFKLFAAQTSGDWREVGADGLCLIAVHSVVSPGFAIKPNVHVANARTTALVAAGGLPPRPPEAAGTTLGTGADVIETAVAAGIAQYEARKQAQERLAAVATALGESPVARMERIRAGLEV